MPQGSHDQQLYKNMPAHTPLNQAPAHIVALLTACLWGTTFISTKVLLMAGLSPAQIFVLRFLLAYMAIVVVCHKRLFCSTAKDELLMLGLGATGGSVYFLAENASLCTSPATNVSIIVCSCPLLTMLLFHLLDRSRVRRLELAGSVLAFVGMATVVCNGHFVLHLSPLGDLLAFCACLCWACYSILLRYVGDSYSSLFITRKVFFYGLLTILPVSGVGFFGDIWPLLWSPVVAGNLLFLGLVASFACFLAWTWAIRRIGVVSCTNYVYLNPLTTIVFASLFLGEAITPFFVAGACAIVGGLWCCNART